MPKLKFMDRKWYFAGDDFALATVGNVTARALWVLLMSIAIFFPSLVETDINEMCRSYVPYVCLVIAIFCLTIACEVQIFHVSLRGTMVDAKPRDELRHYLKGHIAISVLQILTALFGYSQVLSPLMVCTEGRFLENRLHIFLGIVLFTQCLDVSVWAFLYLVCSESASTMSHQQQQRGGWSSEDDQQLLESRCRFVCKAFGWFSCNIFGGRFTSSDSDSDFHAIASILTRLFHHGNILDIVPSDVLAGVALVVLQQKAAATRGVPVMGYSSLSTPPPQPFIYRPLVPGCSEDRDVVDKVAYYSPYSIAVYSVIMYLFVYPITGWCRLLQFAAIRCSSCLNSGSRSGSGSDGANMSRKVPHDGYESVSLSRRSSRSGADGGVVLGDCASCHRTALQKMLDGKDSELRFASFLNDTVAKPYAIVWDHSRRSVVLTIRGTLSLDDCVADIVAHNSELTHHGRRWGFEGKGRWAHSGMLRSAEWLLDDVNNRVILSPLVHESECREIVLVGHSFGAGVAAIATFFLQGKYPGVRVSCVGVGMPSAVVDEQTCRDMADYTLSITQGSDLVGRLSIQSLRLVRRQVLEAICRARSNKFVILRALFTGETDDFTMSQLLHPEGDAPVSVFAEETQEFLRVMTEQEERADDVELFMPGRVFHMSSDESTGLTSQPRSVSSAMAAAMDVNPIGSGVGGGSGSSSGSSSSSSSGGEDGIAGDTQPSIIERDPRDFREIFFHHRMAVDHFPHNYIQNINAIRTKWDDRYETNFMDIL